MALDPAAERSALRIRLLGGMQLLERGGALKFAAPPKAASLLAYLIVHRSQPAARDAIAFAFWPDDDETRARANLRRHVALILRALPARAVQPVVAENRSLQWNARYPCTIDVAEFEELSRDTARAEDAAALYAGDLLPDAYDEWILPERERLRSLQGTNLERLTECYANAGDHARAIATTRSLLLHDPWREDAVRTLISLRNAAGDRAGALQEYERFAERLQRDLDAAPMPQTVGLYESLRSAPSSPAVGPPGSALERAVVPATMAFVGRAEELRRLRQMWVRTMRGQGGVAVISGEAGIGKSRLLGELAATVAAQGGAIAAGAATFPEAVPYQAVTEALRSTLSSIAALPLDAAWLAAAADVLPDLRDVDPTLPRLSALDPAREQDRLFEAVWRCFEALAHVRPLLLRVEDVHWAGPATTALLAYLARRARGHPMLVIVTSRDDEVEPLHALRRALRRSGSFSTIAVGGLTEDDVARVVDGAFRGTGDTASFVKRVHELSCGNPFFLAEIVRDCLAHPAMLTEPALPQSLAATIEARVAALSADAQSLAEIAAVVGRGFTVEIVAAAAGVSESVAVRCMDELLGVRLIRAASRAEQDSDDDLSFTHDLIRSQLYARIPDARCRRLHRRVGMVLETLRAGERDALAAELAHHFDRGMEPEKAAAAYLISGRLAVHVNADGEALLAFSRAVELTADVAVRTEALSLRESIHGRAGRRIEQLADMETLETLAAAAGDENQTLGCMRRRVVYARAVDDVGGQERWIDALRSRITAGQRYWHAFCSESSAALLTSLGRYDEGLGSAREAAVAYKDAGDDGGVVRSLCLIADIRTLKVEPAAAQAALDEATAIAVASSNEASIVRALATASLAAYMSVDYERAHATAKRGLEISRTIGDRESEADFLFRLANIAGRRFAVADAVHMYASATSIYEALNKPLGQAIVLLNTGLLYLKIGEHTEALAMLKRARAIFFDMNDLRGLTVCALNLGMAAYLRGRFGAALRLSHKAVTLARRLGNPQLECSALGNVGAAERELGDRDASVLHSEAALAQRRRMAPMDIGSDLADMGLTYVRAGNIEEACAIAREIEALPAAALESVMFPQNVLWSAARMYDAAARHESYVRVLRRAITMFEERLAKIPNGPWRRTYGRLSFNREISEAEARESDALRTAGSVHSEA